MEIVKGPYDGWWVKEGDKVLGWFAEEIKAKEFMEGK